MGDEIKAAEARGYSKGYQAGKRRKSLDISAEQFRVKKDAFWRRAFLAAIPAALSAQRWTRGGTEIATLPDRISLAAEAADEALKHAVNHL